VPGDDEVAAVGRDALPVTDEVTLPAVFVMEMAELALRRRPEVHVVDHSRREQAPERLFVAPRSAGAGGKREHAMPFIEDQDRSHRRRLAESGWEPAFGEIRQRDGICNGRDDVVLLDDLLVEAVGLLVGEPSVAPMTDS
jgi:hypothetical protein